MLDEAAMTPRAKAATTKQPRIVAGDEVEYIGTSPRWIGTRGIVREVETRGDVVDIYIIVEGATEAALGCGESFRIVRRQP